MWNYEKRLQYPVKITRTNPKMAQVIISQFGGPDGELAASMRYLSQRYTMPYKEVTGTLTDIGTEELAHLEMICAIVYQLTKDLTPEEIEKYGFEKYYVDHTLALWPQAAAGTPWTATYFQSKGDPITDLHEDMAAEQKARTTYDNILRLIKDPEICDPIRFLREREIVHYQRFGESLRIVQDHLDSKTSTPSTRSLTSKENRHIPQWGRGISKNPPSPFVFLLAYALFLHLSHILQPHS